MVGMEPCRDHPCQPLPLNCTKNRGKPATLLVMIEHEIEYREAVLSRLPTVWKEPSESNQSLFCLDTLAVSA
jgi:hypothetical protein